MPVHSGVDNIKGHYFQYGTKGKKYYYKTVIGKKRAYTKAIKQGQAIEISRHRKK